MCSPWKLGDAEPALIGKLDEEDSEGTLRESGSSSRSIRLIWFGEQVEINAER